uniref:Vesicle-associated membrane protein 5-like protein n=1 Tax=Callorhinchus milii TaxID=7868 RepID=V9L3N5_CALMI
MNGSKDLQKLQSEAEEIKDLMHGNVVKIKEREEKLTVLEDRATVLEEAGKTFQKTSHKVAQQEKFKNRKYKIILGIVLVTVTIILLAIILWTCIPRGSAPTSYSSSTEVRGSESGPHLLGAEGGVSPTSGSRVGSEPHPLGTEGGVSPTSGG